MQVVRCQDERIWVSVGSQTGCPACDNGEGCGAGLFAKLLQHKPVIIELARRDIKVNSGQMLTLAFPERVYLEMVLAFYGWPLLAALIGALAGYGFGLWLQWGSFMLDAGTLIGGILAGGVLVHILKRKNSAGAVLNSLKMAVYYPSATPNMCTDVTNEPNTD